ncbi:dUTP diphosphatase [Lutispora saccharofermentans]|uniref:Deoxyuridine 5'-triphosphate nucleotidohydrolase n=1 Tax=Lutispora saccharofermentans TaxID=3024236 RepID=A0ABT1NBE1_9FIRM|nr:dUTP diphosphatase [Lutispora saccharofermentans]MCQ1527944.1 dUTP diphosphatase [Lutispora saccharofermentans]
MDIEIKIKRIEKDFAWDFILPDYATTGSAGMDLRACIKEPVVIESNSIKSIPTGIAIHIADKSVGGFVFPRSGLAAKHGISLINSVGVIDSDYTGEIICPIINHSSKDYIVNPGDRIAQIVFMPIYTAHFVMADVLEDTMRGPGGFGSTGK